MPDLEDFDFIILEGGVPNPDAIGFVCRDRRLVGLPRGGDNGLESFLPARVSVAERPCEVELVRL